MRVEDTGERGRTVTAFSLLDDAEDAFLRAEFSVVRPILQRLENEFGTPPDEYDIAERYAVLRSALAARVGNWPEAVRWCPDRVDLGWAETGVVQALAVSALRRLSEEGRQAEAGVAALVIVLWAYLLDEEDDGDFYGLLVERRGTPVPEELWEDARRHLRRRVTELLHALDVRAGRDALDAWQTAWEAESVTPSVVTGVAGPDRLISLGHAARHLLTHGRRVDLLDAYTARHPDPDTWAGDTPEHRACAEPLAQALAERGQDRVRAGEWGEALADFSAAVRLGRGLGAGEQAAVIRAGQNVGRSFTGRGNSLVARIHGLELAHALLPQNASLAAELTAVLVQRGQDVLKSDPAQSRRRFARALVVTPKDPDARSGLDRHLRADLRRVLDGTYQGDELRVAEVQDLFQRDPECVPARAWLVDRCLARAVAAAADGLMGPARDAVRELLRYDGAAEPVGDALVDRTLVTVLVGAAQDDGAMDTRVALERRVELLSAAESLADPARHLGLREQLDTALLLLAEHLEAAASPSDVIELFLRDLTRIGVQARFDQTVVTAYLNRARARELAGDPGGARRDRGCAERIGAGLPDQGLLFGPGADRPGQDDFGQETLF